MKSTISKADKDPSLFPAPAKRKGKMLAPVAALMLAAACSVGSGGEKDTNSAPVTTTTLESSESTTSTTASSETTQRRSEMQPPQLPTGGDYDIAAKALLSVYQGASPEEIAKAQELVVSISDPTLEARAREGLEYGIAADAILDVYSAPTPEDFIAAQEQTNALSNESIKAIAKSGLEAARQADAALDEYVKTRNAELASQFSGAQSATASAFTDLQQQVAHVFVEDYYYHTTSYLEQYNNAPE